MHHFFLISRLTFIVLLRLFQGFLYVSLLMTFIILTILHLLNSINLLKLLTILEYTTRCRLIFEFWNLLMRDIEAGLVYLYGSLSCNEGKNNSIYLWIETLFHLFSAMLKFGKGLNRIQFLSWNQFFVEGYIFNR